MAGYKKSALTKAGAIICIIVLTMFGLILGIGFLRDLIPVEKVNRDTSSSSQSDGGITISVEPTLLPSETVAKYFTQITIAHSIASFCVIVISIFILTKTRTLLLSFLQLIFSVFITLCYSILYDDCCGSFFLIIPLLCCLGSILSIIGSFIDRGKANS